MDLAFSLNEEGRSNFVRFVLHSFGCTYICLWSYLPQPTNGLFFKDGIYNDHQQSKQSLSSASYHVPPVSTREHFNQYRNSVFMVQNDTVPGLAFKNNIPYFQLKYLELIRLASIPLQSQFYQEAKIKTAVFMGCKSGEIEVGFSHEHITQMNIESDIRNWLQQNFIQNESNTPQTTPNQSRVLSSSSTSLRSIESSDYSPLLFNKPSTPSSYMHRVDHFKETSSNIEQALSPIFQFPTTSNAHAPRGQLQVNKQATTPTQNSLLPPLDSSDIDAAMTRAMLAVIASSSSSPSSHSENNKKLSAFRSYNESGLPPSRKVGKSSILRSQNMFKRAITYLRSMRLRGAEVPNMPVNRPSTTQLHHMLSERNRRQKLNDTFQSLRSLIPPGSKRDKASVLANTRDYLTTLKARVSDLTRKNELLEAQLSSINREHNYDVEFEKAEEAEGSSSERIKVRVTDVSESTSTQRMVNVNVNVNVRVFGAESGCLSKAKTGIAIQLLEFFRNIENVSLVSLSTYTGVAESSNYSSTLVILFRLKLEGELDKSTLEEALKEYLLTWYNGQFPPKGE